MAQQTKNKTVGGGFASLNGLDMGQVNGINFSRELAKLEHRTNAQLMLKRDLVIPIESAVGVSFNFEDITGQNLNNMFGMPGFRTPMFDYRLSGGLITPGTFTSYPKLETEYAQMRNTPEGMLTWSRLTFPLYGSDSAAPVPVAALSAVNTSAGTKNAYVGYWLTIEKAAGNQSIISNVAIVPHDSGAASDGNIIQLSVRFDSSHVATDKIRLWRAAFTYNAATKSYIGTPTTDMGVHMQATSGGTHVTDIALVDNDPLTFFSEAKTAVITSSGKPNTGISSVTNASDVSVTYDWLTDYDVIPAWKSGAGIRRVATGDIAENEIISITYYWNAAKGAELPLGSSKERNIVVPLRLVMPFPSGDSSIIVDLWRVQVNQSFFLALNERDWTNIPFVGDALDAEEEYPDYPYGRLMLYGKAAEAILAGNNYGAFLQDGEFLPGISSAA